jgi:hypothetical protein
MEAILTVGGEGLNMDTLPQPLRFMVPPQNWRPKSSLESSRKNTEKLILSKNGFRRVQTYDRMTMSQKN